MERKKYQRIGAEQWRQHVRAQGESGKSITEYCQQVGVSASGFYGWRQRLGKKRTEAGFVRLDVGARSGALGVIITTPNGYRVEAGGVEVGIATARRLAQVC